MHNKLYFFLKGWEEAPRRKHDDFSDWDANRGNGSSRRNKNDDDNSSDVRCSFYLSLFIVHLYESSPLQFSADEATERRDTPSGRESKSSGRFGGEFRDSDEAPKRQEKEFRFDVDKQKSVIAKPTKKVDLGAAAFYKVDPIPASPVSVIYF